AEMVRGIESRMLHDALDALPVNFREILILRELEGMSYKEIAEVVNVPMGTVMSSLARGRERLREILVHARQKEASRGRRSVRCGAARVSRQRVGPGPQRRIRGAPEDLPRLCAGDLDAANFAPGIAVCESVSSGACGAGSADSSCLAARKQSG